MRYGNAAKLNHYYNNLEARKQFVRACWLASSYQVDSPLLSTDPASIGWRKLDRITEKIMAAINEAGANPPVSWDNLLTTTPPAPAAGASERSE